jgi:hypothetical protein
VEDKKKQDLEDVIRAESRRGKRPIDIEERRRRAQLQRDFRTLLEEGSKEDFVKAIRALGLRDGSPEFEHALSIWNETREPRK